MKQSKTVRFDALVRASGIPEQVTLWTKPEEDAAFMKAVDENRVVTVVQTNVGAKKDFGLVGFAPRKKAAFLVFPKNISQRIETKVIGIKYERIATPEPKGPIHKSKHKKLPGIPMREKPRLKLPEEEKEDPQQRQFDSTEQKRTSGEKAGAPKRKPKTDTFSSNVTITATQTVTLSVEAASTGVAHRLVRSQAKKLELDLTEARISRKVSAPKKRRS